MLQCFFAVAFCPDTAIATVLYNPKKTRKQWKYVWTWKWQYKRDSHWSKIRALFTALIADAHLTTLDDRVEASIADVPDAPVDVHWTVCDGRVVQLHWKLLSENYSPVRRFIIEYNTSWSPDVWRPARSDIGRDVRYFRVALSPWSNYSFRVVAQNNVGRSRPSDMTRPWCTTPPDVPRRHPRQVCARNGQPHTLVIGWQVTTAATN